MVRNETESSYGSDYAEIVPLKSLAEQLGISIVLVHHLRKTADSDPFNMISGSTGLSGATDGQLVLKKDKRCGGQAVLYVTGRDVEDQELSLTKCGARWVLADEHTDKPPDLFSFAVHDLMTELVSFKGSATELSAELADHFGLTLPSNMVSKKLMQHWQELSGYGVRFESKRSHGKRWLELTYDPSGDSSAGRKLYPETCCPTGTQDVESSLDTLSAQGDGTTQGDGRSCSGNSTDPEYLLIEGKQVPVVRFSFDDIINRSAAKIRAQIYRERGILVPEFRSET